MADFYADDTLSTETPGTDPKEFVKRVTVRATASDLGSRGRV
eukprot:CAMPEP_0180201730 /NCGR_PEP_ID=MMETSP0987-20121128/6911_1 /TAXON_ID=697907 /ORGANISM="non described non described, Strain CCMP2293" /LENGTH=41 /DNA_ID= /DNA_START= /DNA_END= /DNA_ORIENTATION=